MKERVQFSEAIHNFRTWSQKEGKGFSVVHTVTFTHEKIGFAESKLQLAGRSYPDLPIAIALEIENEEALSLRLYHSHWALEERHRIRKPLFPPDRNAILPPDVRAYHEALASGSIDKAVTLFDKTAIASEPSGGTFEGVRGIKDFFRHAFKDGELR